MFTTALTLQVVSGNLNSDPHAYVTSALFTEPLPYLGSHFYIRLVCISLLPNLALNT